MDTTHAAPRHPPQPVTLRRMPVVPSKPHPLLSFAWTPMQTPATSFSSLTLAAAGCDASASRSAIWLRRRWRLRAMSEYPCWNGNSEVQQRILSGRADANIRFDDLRLFLLRLGFVERGRGSSAQIRNRHLLEQRRRRFCGRGAGASLMCGPRRHAGGGAGTDHPSGGIVARNRAGVRRPHSGTEGRARDAGMTNSRTSLPAIDSPPPPETFDRAH